MKALVVLALLGAVQAQAANGGDGCFQMYQPGALFPVICVSGSNEEGIGGANAKVALIHAGQVIWCGKTKSIALKSSDPAKNQRVYTFDRASGMITIEFNGFTNAEGRQEGDVTLIEVKDRSDLKYLELLPANLSRLPKYLESAKCRNAK